VRPSGDRGGLLSFRDEDVDAINSDPDWIFSTLSNGTAVTEGAAASAFRIGPLVVKRSQVERACRALPLSVLSWRPFPTALVTTGREIFEGTVRDAFLPRLQSKIASYGAPLLGHGLCPDDAEAIAGQVLFWLGKGAPVVLCRGGMSVDADDRTPRAIESLCDGVLFRRVPVIPGASLMLARRGESFVIGVPASAVFAERTALDILSDRIYGECLHRERK
jgi:molybdopterin biosynthesis enzyme MoaB